MNVDLLIEHADQLVTVASPDGPRRGAQMGELEIIRDGAIAVRDGVIVAVGTTYRLLSVVRQAAQTIDATGCAVVPGFVDAHTHVVFAGDRVDEFEQRLAGATYQEIMAAGGGIMSTVHAVRAADEDGLARLAAERLRVMLAHGTTTVEAKTGYGLATEDELKMLRAIDHLHAIQPIDLVPTFLGAHATPAEYAGRSDAYLDLVVEEMLPAVHARGGPLPFVDIFCDEGAFTVAQLERVLGAARDLGFPLKAHLDEFAALGGTPAAAALGATSVDHLVVSGEADLAALAAHPGTIPTLMPATPFGLGWRHYAPARRMIDEYGLAVALGSDMNPGTCWCPSMAFVMALACRGMAMTPAEALCAATLNAAHAVGRGDRLGSLEVGKQGDMLILAVPDYRHLAYRVGENLVKSVIKRGQIVYGDLVVEATEQ
ncbi:MAG TPA: imidazolonepropionase [Roseiflexaceae bacterium]|nr:imidazolonepropionase [Roseiflexaceae bacterium]